MLIAFALSTAFAYSIAAPCPPLMVRDTRPALGQTDVPTDARLVAVLYGDCGGSGTYLVELLGADGAVLQSDTQTVTVPDMSGLLVLTPEGGLASNTDHVLRVTPEDGGEVSEVAFTTGDGQVVGLGAGVPSLSLEYASATKVDGEWVVAWGARIDAAADPDGLSLVGILSEEEGVDGFAGVAAPDSAGIAVLYGSQTVSEKPRELCLDAVQLDGLGVESEAVEACLEVDRQGCSTAPAAPGLFAAVLALLGLRRRASPRGHSVV
ncbi:MAG: hypothetical protein RIT28_3064 [Pseudomonadota bacterium]